MLESKFRKITMAPNFQTYEDVEILRFVIEHPSFFGCDESDIDTEQLFLGLQKGEVFVEKIEQGFAIAYRGRLYSKGDGHNPADLMFVYVDDRYRGQGYGKFLVDVVKSKIDDGISIVAVCKGEARKRTFEKYGFVWNLNSVDEDQQFELTYTP